MSKPNRTTLTWLACLFLVLCLQVEGYGQQHTVTGTVYAGETSEENILPGVNVVVKGTTIGTSTDENGDYSLAVPSVSDTLVFSFIGFRTLEVPVEGRSEINVNMEQSAQSLEEMVVVGYGEQTKESVIGAISSISGEDLQKAESGGNMMTTLQGEVPGLTVFTTSMKPGETQTVMQIRAATSMGSNTPLFIVDGVERQSIASIDPVSIASISVLKGASATAVYGVKAANGVVIVKTKRGRSGDIKMSFSSETTVKQPTRMPRFMNAYETLKLRNEAYRNDGRWDQIVSDEVLEHYRKQDMPYIYSDFDWMDYLWEPAVDHKYNLNASGGSEFVQFFASVSYLSENDIMNNGPSGLFPYEMNHNYKNDRFNFRNNLDFKLSESTQLSVQLSGNIQDWNRPIDWYTQELMFEPVTALPYYPEEALEQYPDDRIPYNQSGIRPYIDPTQGNVRLMWVGGYGVTQQKSNDFNANIVLNQELSFITQGLDFEGLYSYQNGQSYGANHYLGGFYGYHLKPDGTWVRYTQTGDKDLNTPQPKLNIVPNKSLWGANRSRYYNMKLLYDRSFDDHNITGTGVFSRRQARGIANFPSYEESWALRGTYNYRNLYFLESSVSHTGSEKFARGKRFGTFPSFGVGYMLSNEDYFKEAFPWFDHLKVKYTWGQIGSDAGIDRWLYRSSYSPNAGSVAFGDPLQGYSIIEQGDVPVSATWETSIKQNIGIEMGFFDSQLTVNVDLYNERREDILQTRNSVPAWFGVSSGVSANIGETKAHGIEVEIGYDKTFASGLNLFIKANGSIFESRVVNWDEPNNIPFHLRAEGKPVDIARRMNWYTPSTGVQVMGMYQDFDELFMWPLASGSPILGDHKFLDYNGDGSVNELDRIPAKYPFTPTYNWNANLGFSYKNWTVQATFYGISNTNFQLRQGGMWYIYPFAQSKNNAMTTWSDHWTPSNTDAQHPAVHSEAEGHYNQRISTNSSLNGQYIRLKRAFIQYRLKTEGLTRMGVDQVELSLTGTNLWTWTKLPFGGDPEGGNYGGQDFGAYPMQTRYGLRARVSF